MMGWLQHIKKTWLDYHWSVFGLFGVFAIGLGCVGFEKYFLSIGQTYTYWDLLYRSIQLFVMEGGAVHGMVPWELQLARFLAPLTAAYIAVSALALVFRDQFNLIRIRFLKGHVVICGLGRKGMLLAQKYRQQQKQVVIIELDEINEMLAQCRNIGCIVLIGNAADPDLLKKAMCHKASYLFTLSGNDGVNAKIAVHARELVKHRRDRVLSCIVHVVEPQLCNLLKEQEFLWGSQQALRLEFFNIYDSGARIWLKKHPPFRFDDSPEPKRPHLILVGAGKMGESLLVQLAQKWRLLNSGTEKFPVTVIDKKAMEIQELFGLLYPLLEEICELNYLQMDVGSPEFQRGGFLFDQQKKCLASIIYVCLDNDTRALFTAMSMFKHVRNEKIKIVVRTTREAGISSLLTGSSNQGQTTLVSFALLDQACQTDIIFGGSHETIARAIHEEYVSNRLKSGESPESNPSITDWKNLPEHLKESNRQQADHISEKLSSIQCGIAPLSDWGEQLIRFSDDEALQMARMEHKRWCLERSAKGWKLGKKNARKKTTHLLVPWEQLSEKDKKHNVDMARKMPVFMAKAGLKIFRLNKAKNAIE